MLAYDARVLHQVKPLDLVDDGAEENGSRGVPEPGVELAVRFRGAQQGVAVVPACGLGFFGERDHVRRVLEIPMLMGPEGTCGADAGLDLVDDQQDVVAARESAQATEKGGGRVVVAAF